MKARKSRQIVANKTTGVGSGQITRAPSFLPKFVLLKLCANDAKLICGVEMNMPDETDLTVTLRQRIADAILDSAGDAIIACGTDGIIRFWNLGARRIFGFDGTEAVGYFARHHHPGNKSDTGKDSTKGSSPDKAIIRKVTFCPCQGTVKTDHDCRSNSRPLRLRKVAEL